MINFVKSEINLEHEYKGNKYKKTLYPDYSIYMKLFIKFALGNLSKDDSNLFCIGISGAIGLAA
tara:strand:- start:283 stop:474 length:192 start_codon:yes stop_codon:yes gene_type:complete